MIRTTTKYSPKKGKCGSGLDMCSECHRHPYPGLPLDGHLMAAGDVKKNSRKRDEGTGMDLGILGGCCSRETVKRIKY